ncbi:MAG: hypothetical protein JXB05_33670 [Myxococcaceae bacterium]|nr:hypothetical protein [Myxococcaceae bacterium]
MTTLSELVNAHAWIGTRWSHSPSPEEALILKWAQSTLDFIFATGQRDRFEDFSYHGTEAVEPPLQGSSDVSERLRSAERFFERLLHQPAIAGEDAPIQAILQALRFIAATRQDEALDAYVKYVESRAPPFAVAHFETLAEAEAWLHSHPHPPDPARVLIGNAFHDVVHERETNIRRLPRNRDLHDYLAELTRVEPPAVTVSFGTREEATSWLWAQPAPTTHAWVSIAGELYLAAYHPNLGHRALYPLSMAEASDASA